MKWNEEYGIALSTLIYVLALRPIWICRTSKFHIRKSVGTGESLTQVHRAYHRICSVLICAAEAIMLRGRPRNDKLCGVLGNGPLQTVCMEEGHSYGRD